MSKIVIGVLIVCLGALSMTGSLCACAAYVPSHIAAIATLASRTADTSSQYAMMKASERRAARVRMKEVLAPLISNELPSRVEMRDEQNARTIILKGVKTGIGRYHSYTIMIATDEGVVDLPRSMIEIVEEENMIKLQSFYIDDLSDYKFASEGIGRWVFAFFVAYAQNKGKGLYFSSSNYSMLRLAYFYGSSRTRYVDSSEDMTTGAFYQDMDWFTFGEHNTKNFLLGFSEHVHDPLNVTLIDNAAIVKSNGYVFKIYYRNNGYIEIKGYYHEEKVPVKYKIILNRPYYAQIAPEDIGTFHDMNGNDLYQNNTGQSEITQSPKLPSIINIKDKKNGIELRLKRESMYSDDYRVWIKEHNQWNELPRSKVAVSVEDKDLKIRNMSIDLFNEFKHTAKGYGRAILNYFALWAQSNKLGIYYYSKNYGLHRMVYKYISAYARFGPRKKMFDEFDWFHAEGDQKKLTVLMSAPIMITEEIILINDKATILKEGYEIEVELLQNGFVSVSAVKNNVLYETQYQIESSNVVRGRISSENIFVFEKTYETALKEEEIFIFTAA